MEDEKFITGYCRQNDRSRVVTVELTDGKAECWDCGFGSCVYQPNCPIAREIERLKG